MGLPKGYKFSEGAKLRLKGRIPWNKGMKGYKYSEEAKQKMKGSKFKKGYKLSDIWRKHISESHKGYKYSAEARLRLMGRGRGISKGKKFFRESGWQIRRDYKAGVLCDILKFIEFRNEKDRYDFYRWYRLVVT